MTAHGPQHPAPWWYRLAARWWPDRCREVPEAQNPDRIVLRQVALIKRYVYLQQFASSEDFAWFHSHQWRRTIAIGLWGDYLERRPGWNQTVSNGWPNLGRDGAVYRVRMAPYCYTMSDQVVHHVQVPSPGHTSIFIGLGPHDDDLKHYYTADGGEVRRWDDHIKVKVRRI